VAKGQYIKGPGKIGIIHPRIDGWVAGPKFLRVLTYSLGQACRAVGIELYVLCESSVTIRSAVPLAKVVSVTPPNYFSGERRLRHFLGLPDKSGLARITRDLEITVLLWAHDVTSVASKFKTIGWIPDFQHVYLPQFFSAGMREFRDSYFRMLSETCALVMLSSHNALEHFSSFAPEHAHKGRVASFPSIFAFEPPQENNFSARQRFNIPAKFALVANQFWGHKNHAIVVEALRLLKKQGVHIPVVMTGLPADYRYPNNEPLSCLLQAVASAGLVSEVTVLGMLPETELVNLMRSAAILIQPSRFEGWSMVVQECKALGRPLVCSDIPIHHEQAPGALGFFPSDNPEVLADLLAAHWLSLEAGPNLFLEQTALVKEREFASQHGAALLRICEEAYSA
jgi:glycosyltransferase involved in cell wall biosynthesis